MEYCAKYINCKTSMYMKLCISNIKRFRSECQWPFSKIYLETNGLNTYMYNLLMLSSSVMGHRNLHIKNSLILKTIIWSMLFSLLFYGLMACSLIFNLITKSRQLINPSQSQIQLHLHFSKYCFAEKRHLVWRFKSITSNQIRGQCAFYFKITALVYYSLKSHTLNKQCKHASEDLQVLKWKRSKWQKFCESVRDRPS